MHVQHLQLHFLSKRNRIFSKCLGWTTYNRLEQTTLANTKVFRGGRSACTLPSSCCSCLLLKNHMRHFHVAAPYLEKKMMEIFIIDPPWPASRMCLPMYFDNSHAPSKFVLKTSSHSSSEISSEESVPPNKHNFKGNTWWA